MHGEIRVVDDVPSVFAEVAAEAFESRTRTDLWTIAFSGGSTARPCYEALTKTDIDWSHVVAVWGDERRVPLDHDDSNYKLVEETLLDRCGPLKAVHPMGGDVQADEYQSLLEPLLPIDFVHLGMGDDGHTASLFPGSAALDAPAGQLVVEAGDDSHRHPRLTLTFDAISRSRLVVFTLIGESKREMFTKVCAGEDFPAGRVHASRVVWLVDHAAAGS